MNYMPRAKTDPGMCGQHHVPAGECPPSSRHPHTVRVRDDDWEGAQAAHGREEIAGWIEETIRARLGYIRCWRCPDDAPPVTLIPGDLTGMTLDEATVAAVKQAERQHPRHEPVWLGAPPPAVQPGAAVFMEPGAAPVITSVPPVPDHSRKRGKAASGR